MTKNQKIIAIISFSLLLISTGAYFWLYSITAKELFQTLKKLAQTSILFQNQGDFFQNRIKDLQTQVFQAESDKSTLSMLLTNEKDKNNFFQEQISAIQGTVSNLEKLKKLDPELLQKYSRVYFLNENYRPASLTPINPDYLLNKGQPNEIHSQVWPFLEKMLNDASSSSQSLLIVSAFRSFESQAALKYGYLITYGSGANQFSADQGYSEHQLGTTIDLINSGSTNLTSKFENTNQYKWLQENAHKYGFVLSYPKGNRYYIFEPWHWRFVGTKLAQSLHDQNKTFYDMDQREIDSYLISIFD